MSTPKPCPFCGHVGLDFREGSTFRWVIAECAGCGAGIGETRIQTLGDGTKEEWMAEAQKDAIAAWNRRAALAAQPGAVGEPSGWVDLTEAEKRALINDFRVTKYTHFEFISGVSERLKAKNSASTEAKPDCSGGIACTTCPNKRKCQRGCIRQGEALENPDRKDLRAECDAVDALLRGLGLDPERCRTEGGALNVGRTLSLLADGVKAKPAKADALNTLCKMLHSGEEVEGDDGLAMLVPMDLWNEAQEAIELLVVEDEAIEAKPAQDAVDAEAGALSPEQEEWVMDLAQKHNLGRRVGQIGTLQGVSPDVFYTDASYRTQELFDFAAELLASSELNADQRRALVGNWFAEDWAVHQALGLLDDYDTERAAISAKKVGEV